MTFIPILVSLYSLGSIAATSTVAPRSIHSEVSLYVESNQGRPAFVSGRLVTSVERGDEVAATISFLEDNKSAYRMTRPAEEIRIKRVDSDRAGNRHLRFNQYFNGIPVQWGDLVSHFDIKGVLRSVNGTYHPGIALDVAPNIALLDAVAAAEAELPSTFGDVRIHSNELIILPWDDSYYLCWHLVLQSSSSFGRWEYWVDAHAGAVILGMDAIKKSDEIGTGLSVLSQPRNHIDVWKSDSLYQLRDNTRQLNRNIHGHNGQMPDGNYIQTNIAGATLPGPIGEDADNYWSGTFQRPAVDAHVYAGLFYDWLLREFGRNSYDNNGSSMISSVNWTGTPNGAFWTGSQTVFPQWSYPLRSWASCPDIVAHEFTHGIIDNTSILVYTWESGALNEAFCNMMGTAFEFAHDTLDDPDWLLAENAITVPGFVRSMSNPDSTNQPSYVGGPYWLEPEGCVPSVNNDYCGVHINCGVIHKWFYLLSEGGTFRSILVEGIGIENAIQIVFQANAYYWTATVDFRQAAIGTYYAALDLDPTGAWAAQVVNGWNAVNVDIPIGGLSFDYPIGTPLTLQPQQETRVEVEIGSLVGGEPSPASGNLYYSIDGGPFNGMPMTPESDNYYSVYLPALWCGQTIEYYFSAEEIGGSLIFDPDPTNPFKARVSNENNIQFADDFESDKGWTVHGNATDGVWERGVPIVSGSIGAPVADYDGSGSCFLTANVAGESDVDGGSTHLVSPPFDLKGTDGVLSYAAYLDMRFDETLIPDDLLYVYITNDSGATWELVDRIGPNPSFDGVWSEYSFLVSDFVEPTDQLQIRFEITDVGLESAVEAAIDAVEISRYDCNCCFDLAGNVDYDLAGSVDIADLTYLVAYMFRGGPAPPCNEEANINGASSVDISDLTYLVAFMFGGGPSPHACP